MSSDVYDPIGDLEERSGLDLDITVNLPYSVDLTRATSITPLRDTENPTGLRGNRMYVADMNGSDNAYVWLVKEADSIAVRIVVGANATRSIISRAGLDTVCCPVFRYDADGGYVVSEGVEGGQLMDYELTERLQQAWVDSCAVALLIGDRDFGKGNYKFDGEQVCLFDFDNTCLDFTDDYDRGNALDTMLRQAKFAGYKDERDEAGQRIKERATEIAQQVGRLRLRMNHQGQQQHIENINKNIEFFAQRRW